MEMTPAEQIEHIRKRPGMYVGGTGPSGVLHMVLEVVSNSFDQVLAGRASRIEVSVDDHGTITIHDDGPGMGGVDVPPVALQSHFTRTRNSPTADGHWPHVHLSVGTGLGPVCALSSHLEVETRRADGWFRQSFARGAAVTELEHSSTPFDGETGTTTRLTPDAEIFGDTRIDLDALSERLEGLAFLEPRLTATLATPGAGLEVYGPFDDLTTLFDRLYGKQRSRLAPDIPMLMSSEGDDFAVDLVLGWSDHRYGAEVESFGNYRQIAEPGWELDGIEEGLRDVLGSGPMRHSSRGPMAGLRAVLHVKLLDPKFPGPTGRRLASPEATWVVADLIAEQLPVHLARHPELAASLIARTNTRTHQPADGRNT